MRVYVAADLNPEAAKHALCVSAAMRVVDDTSLRQCIFLLMSISQHWHVFTLNLIMLLCGSHGSVYTGVLALLPSLHQFRALAGLKSVAMLTQHI